jgi:hypothetical protein
MDDARPLTMALSRNRKLNDARHKAHQRPERRSGSVRDYGTFAPREARNQE